MSICLICWETARWPYGTNEVARGMERDGRQMQSMQGSIGHYEYFALLSKGVYALTREVM